MLTTRIQFVAWARIFQFTITLRMALQPTHLPVQWKLWLVHLRIEQPRHLTLSSAKFKNVQSYFMAHKAISTLTNVMLLNKAFFYIAESYLSIIFVAICHIVMLFHFLFRLLYHSSTICSYTLKKRRAHQHNGKSDIFL